MKHVYVIQKNTKYLDGHRVTVNNRVCRICTDSFRRDLVGNQHVPDNHLCGNCQFWYEHWLTRDDKAVVRVDGRHYRMTFMPGIKATIVFHDGSVIKTDCLWHQGTIPAIWVGLGLTDNATFYKGDVNAWN